MPVSTRRVVRFANFIAPTSGGIRSVVRRLSHAQAADGYESWVVAPGPDCGLDPVPGVLNVVHLPGRRLAPGQPYRLILDRRRLRTLLDRLRPDIVEIHDQLTLTWLGAECRRRGIPTVLVAHERLDLLAGFWSRLAPAARPTRSWLAKMGRSVDRVVTPSRFAAQPFTDAGIDVRVVPWGVDHATFEPGEPREPDGVLRLLHCGRLSAEKDPLLSAKTAQYLADRGVPVELTVIGSGPVAPELVKHFGGRLVLTGFVDGPARMAQHLRDADVFLAPGPFETFGVSALEAMACGLPVVCRESGSISEIPQTSPAPGTAAGFGEAALRLWRDAGARDRAAQSASGYTWEQAAASMTEAYGR